MVATSLSSCLTPAVARMILSSVEHTPTSQGTCPCAVRPDTGVPRRAEDVRVDTTRRAGCVACMPPQPEPTVWSSMSSHLCLGHSWCGTRCIPVPGWCARPGAKLPSLAECASHYRCLARMVEAAITPRVGLIVGGFHRVCQIRCLEVLSVLESHAERTASSSLCRDAPHSRFSWQCCLSVSHVLVMGFCNPLPVFIAASV